MNQIRHGWAAATVLTVIVLFGLNSQSIQAQTADPPKPTDAQASQEPADVQQLKDRVKQLEQTVDELKRMIGTVETTQQKQQQEQKQQQQQQESGRWNRPLTKVWLKRFEMILTS